MINLELNNKKTPDIEIIQQKQKKISSDDLVPRESYILYERTHISIEKPNINHNLNKKIPKT